MKKWISRSIVVLSVIAGTVFIAYFLYIKPISDIGIDTIQDYMMAIALLTALYASLYAILVCVFNVIFWAINN